MRIGYYIPGWPPGSVPNGIVTTLGNLGEQLRVMGHEVFYVTPFSKTETRDRNVIVLNDHLSFVEKLNFRWNFEKAFYRTFSTQIADAVETLVRNKGIEVFQMEETHGFASEVIRRVDIPIVVQLAGPWFVNRDFAPTERNKPENRHRVEREGWAILHAAALRAPSNSVISLVKKYYGQLNNPVLIVPNPIPVKPKANRWNVEACDRNIILFVGRFDRLKGADLLLLAFAKVAITWPKVELFFVGPDCGLTLGNGDHVNFAEFVKRTIPDTLHGRIQYLGPLQRSEIDGLRTMAYLSVIPSRYETFGNTVLEAMAAGCPMITANVGGISEIVIHNSNGLVVPAEDVDGLARAMTRLIGDPVLAARLGEQAARDCESRFEPTKIAQRYVDFYTFVIDHHTVCIRR